MRVPGLIDIWTPIIRPACQAPERGQRGRGGTLPACFPVVCLWHVTCCLELGIPCSSPKGGTYVEEAGLFTVARRPCAAGARGRLRTDLCRCRRLDARRRWPRRNRRRTGLSG